MKKILVIWPTYREDWILPFKQLAQDFEFIFLSGIANDESQKNYVKDFAQTIHWSSFSAAQEILQELKPSKLVFMSVDSGLNITLNIVAKKQGIPTYLLQHGIYTNYKDYRIREKIWKKQSIVTKKTQLKKRVGFSSFGFINGSLRGINRVFLLPIILFIKAAQKIGPYWAAKHLSFEGKKPDTYICFSPYNATIHKELDKIDDDRITYIGSPELSQYLEKEDDLIEERFYMHIDQAFAENSFGEETVSKDKMIAFYLKLNEFCKRREAKLYIKLHPESYTSTWLPMDDNIVYLKKVDNFNRYIQSSEACFGFYSTMIIPAVYWKPTILFNIFYSGLQEALQDLEHITIFPFFDFSEDQLQFNQAEIRQDKIAERFFHQGEALTLQLLANELNAAN